METTNYSTDVKSIEIKMLAKRPFDAPINVGC